MKRFLMQDLITWKQSKRRKPLILNGARQVGKTWLLQEFGSSQFKNVAYINFDNSDTMKAQFEGDYDLHRILLALQAETGQKITPAETLIIFDEIQECPHALTSLKYFYETMPDQAIVAAGSLLGITVHSGTGYPVGKVDTLELYPMNFREFIYATQSESLLDIVDSKDEALINSFKSKLIPLLKLYYYIGGMPEVVSVYIESGSLSEARTTQARILEGYERDISKHLERAEIERTISAWKSIPPQLAKENTKFIFGQIKDGARGRDYRAAITWLAQAGLAYKVPRVSKPGIPLASYENAEEFKLFLLDVGLLSAMVQLDFKSILDGNSAYTEFKGALTEQYVCQELISENNFRPKYWSSTNSQNEIDFLVQHESEIYAIEVKAEENLRSKSLRAFKQKFPSVNALRFSLSGFRDEEWMRNIPLYACSDLSNWER